MVWVQGKFFGRNFAGKREISLFSPKNISYLAKFSAEFGLSLKSRAKKPKNLIRAIQPTIYLRQRPPQTLNPLISPQIELSGSVLPTDTRSSTLLPLRLHRAVRARHQLSLPVPARHRLSRPCWVVTGLRSWSVGQRTKVRSGEDRGAADVGSSPVAATSKQVQAVWQRETNPSVMRS